MGPTTDTMTSRMAMNRTRLAVALWIVWAIVVWNVVFDQVLVNAGRDYVRAAMAAVFSAGI